MMRILMLLAVVLGTPVILFLWFMVGEGGPSTIVVDPQTTAAQLTQPETAHREDRAGTDASALAQPIDADVFVPVEDRALGEAAWVIEVVDSDGRPVAEAEVSLWAVDPQSMRFSPETAGPGRPPGLTGLTGTGGLLPIKQLPMGATTIVARRGEQSARVTVPSPLPERQVRLRLRPPWVVEVTVVDALGQPLLGQIVRVGMGSSMGRKVAATDDQGHARFVLDAETVPSAPQEMVQIEVERPDGEMGSRSFLAWEDVGPTKEHVVLACAGSVQVTVVDEADRPVQGSFGLLVRQPTVQVPGQIVWPKPISRDAIRSFEGPSTLVMGLLTPGPRDFLLSEAGQEDVLVSHEVLAAPLRSELRIRRGAAAPRLALAFLDAGGLPWADGTLTVELVYESVAMANIPNDAEPADAAAMTARVQRHFEALASKVVRHTVRTDAEGRLEVPVRPGRVFELRLHGDPAQRPTAQSMTMFAASDAAPLPSEPWHRRSVPALTAGQRFTVDPITVIMAPLLAAGRVVFADGQPAPGAEVEVVAAASLDASTIVARSTNMMGPIVPTLFKATTDEHGRFELRGTPAESTQVPLAVTAWLPSASAIPVPLLLGAQDLELKLIPSGGIAGSVADRPLPSQLVMFLALPDAGPVAPIESRLLRSHAANPGQRFELKGLMPGSYTVVAVDFSMDPLIVVPQVIVRSGEVTEDSRLQAVDLSAAMEEAKITVLDPERRPVVGASLRGTIHSGVPGKELIFGHTTDAEGISWLRRRRTHRVDIRVLAAGYVKFERTNAEFPLEIQLDRGATLHATIPGLGALLQADRSYEGFSIRAKRKFDSQTSDPEFFAERNAFQALEELRDEHGSRPINEGVGLGKIDPARDSAILSGLAPGAYEILLRRDVTQEQRQRTRAEARPVFTDDRRLPAGMVSLGVIEVGTDSRDIQRSFPLSAEAIERLRNPEGTAPK